MSETTYNAFAALQARAERAEAQVERLRGALEAIVALGTEDVGRGEFVSIEGREIAIAALKDAQP